MKVLVRTCTVMVFAIAAATAGAGEYDGLYHSSGHSSRCHPDWIGSDGGAYSIDGNILRGVESHCTLSSPVPVRELRATLFIADCAVEGEESQGLIMLMSHPDGVFVFQDGWISDWRRCP